MRLFGSVGATWRGRPLPLHGRYAGGLLALLALHPEPRSREAIATDLWPDASPSSGAHLRQALWLLARSLDGIGGRSNAVVLADRDSIGLHPDAVIEVDVRQFERLLEGNPPRTEEAIALYSGELVESLGLECLDGYREQLSDLYEDSVARVAQARLGNGDLDGARSAALTLIDRDPLREEAHAVMIQVYGEIGTRAQVARQFRRLGSELDRELGVDALPETVVIYRAAMARTEARSALAAKEASFGRALDPDYARCAYGCARTDPVKDLCRHLCFNI